MIKDQSCSKVSDKLIIPVIIAIGWIPLIVHMFSYRCGLSQFDWFPDSSESQNDFFLAWKMVAIILLGILILGIILYQHVKRKQELRFHNIYYLLVFYLLFVTMSALFSPYKNWVVKGCYEIMEPVWVLFAYILICFYTFHIVQNENQIYTIFKFSFIGTAIALLIGAIQSIGFDPFNTIIGKKIIMNPSAWSLADEMTFAGKGVVYMTVYNPDFVAFFVGLVLPVFIALLIGKRPIYQKLILGILVVLSFMCLIGAGAMSGFIGVFGGFLIGFVILLSRRKKTFLIGGILTALIIITGCIFLIVSPSMQSFRDVIFGTYKTNEEFGVKSIQTADDITFVYENTSTHFSFDADTEQGVLNIYCFDADGNEIEYTEDPDAPGSYMYSDGESGLYYAYGIFIEEEIGLAIQVDDVQWNFVKDEAGTYYYYNTAGKRVSFPDMKTCELFNEDALSGRGHIWNKTIPLLSKHLFIGSGANTYMLECPQDDYLFRNYVNMNNMYDVKPHNWYLQQWVENGLIATLMLIGFYLWYMIQSIRIYRRVSFKEDIHKIGFAILIGTLAYMINGLANDSTVNVATAYWAMIGLGIAVNQMIIKKERLFENAMKTEEEAEDLISDNQEYSVPTVNKKTTSSKKLSRKERKMNKK